MHTLSGILAAVGLAFSVLCAAVPSRADAQWTITMRAMRNPLPMGQCTPVEIVVKDAQSNQGPTRPDGQQVSGWDFDFAVTSSAPDAFRLQNDDPTRPFICAQAPTAASATFTAHYPGRQLKPNQVVPGVELWRSIQVVMEGVSATAAQPNPSAAAGGYPAAPGGSAGYPAGESAAGAGHPGGYPAGGAQASGYAGGGYPAQGGQAGGYPQADPASAAGAAGAYPSGGAPPGSSGYPSGSGAAAGSPPPSHPAGNPSGGYAQGGYPQADPAQTSAYPPDAGYPQPSGYPQPAGYPQAGAPQQGQPNAGTTAAPDSGGVRTGKQFLQRITGFAKRKASEVASSTTTHVADAAGSVVGTTLQSGSDVVKSGTGAVTGAASAQVQGVGRSLGAAPSPKDPADIAAALAAGRAVLYGLRFTEGTAMLEPASGPLISQIAGALARTPGQFLIEAHVDGKNAAAAQALSEQRAAAVKNALVAAGSSPMQLAAVGYGATRPIAGAKSSARIEIARTQ